MIKNIVIVGGGTAGWMTASALARHLPEACDITLVESEQIAKVGVGEATIPVIRQFNAALGIDEKEFMSRTNATFKLGIRFENWARKGDAYNHAFGFFGRPINDISFHHFWLSINQSEKDAWIHDFNVPSVASDLNRYAHRQYNDEQMGSRYFYAFQFDAHLYADYLSEWAQQKGVTRKEGIVNEVSTNPENGFITGLTLDNGEVISGDLFIDCSGFRGLLINQTLGIDFLDWSHWLPCNRAWAVSSAYPSRDAEIPPYTRAKALTAGWQWRIPLQNRTGDGNVFSNNFISEDEGLSQLLENIEGDAINEPRLLKFTTGKRDKLWHKNCVAIGLSGGFLEPLESTSIALIQGAIMLLLKHFPDNNFDPIREQEFNRRMTQKYEESRDFLILHYHATERDDTEFWNYCRTMSVPDEVKFRIELFKKTGFVSHNQSDLFIEHNWLAVLFGQRIIPENYDPRIERFASQEIKELLQVMKQETRDAVTAMPIHNETLKNYCAGDLISNFEQAKR
ncbi:MAG: tryptophan 7-halogenase [Kangiellaceae bacterium]|nr:tryptophan 7-halogenase [Kangiellaceae bacterium]MCW8998563.1 tryptophan 7-halogenase [Kangiellaceae bacterium]MCW9018425.1 tryptophan 7-halogenase [Kangiellaceae bacterium]